MQGQAYDPSQLPARIASKIAIDENGCWIWTGARVAGGYGEISMHGRMRYTHRLSYEICVGPISDGLHICHHCDNRPCCNPSHLFAGTARDNMHDMINKGRGNWSGRPIRYGEASSRAILTEDAVRDIRARYKRGVITCRMLGDEYGVSKTTVEDILHRRTWPHLS